MPDRPNVLFFFSDQQRWDTVGCYGQPMDVTPNLDRMAAEGVRFERSFTCQPVCGPARACIQTGRYAEEVGAWRNGIALPRDATTIAHRMSDAGYDLAYIGKWHLASTKGLGDEDFNCRETAVPPERRGGWNGHWVASDVLEFTSHGYDGYMHDGEMKKREFKGYRVDCVTDFALDYLRTRDRERPFFLFVSYIEPHHQNDRNCYEGPEGSKERFRDFVVPGDLEGTEGDWRENYPDYLGCCASLDENLGRLRAELEEQGVLDDTLVIYTSDHGSHFRTRNGEYKRSCHDGCARTPLVARGPGFRGGKVVEEIASLIDVPATILAAGGAEPLPGMRGRPLQELASEGGAPDDWPEEAFMQISESQVGRAIRTRKWKYSVTAPDLDGWNDARSGRYVEDFLYDLENDPHERDNLVAEADYADVRKELAATLVRRMVAAGESEPEIRPAS